MKLILKTKKRFDKLLKSDWIYQIVVTKIGFCYWVSALKLFMFGRLKCTCDIEAHVDVSFKKLACGFG